MRNLGQELRVAILGCGFWSRFQIPAWLELPNVRCLAVCDWSAERAEATARRFQIPRFYGDASDLMANEKADVVDIITSPDTHRDLVLLAASHRTPVICQKPMAGDFATAKEMVRVCRDAGIPFFVHENWRWQRPIRRLKGVLESGEIGRPFRARIDFNTSFPVFKNQPFLRELDELIVMDLGSHILDVARFLFGEAQSVYCLLERIHPDIRGEDVATILLRMRDGTSVACNLSFASRSEIERFPETYFFVEAEHGSVTLGPDFWIRVITENGTRILQYPSPVYSWADPNYALVQASIVECHRNLRQGLEQQGKAETTAEDNLRTMELVFASYRSAQTGDVVHIQTSLDWPNSQPIGSAD